MANTAGYLRLLAAGLLLAGLASASGCGGDDEEDEADQGSGGTGGSTVSPIECGSNTCEPLIIPIGDAPPVAPCCAGEDTCGLDSTYLEAFGPTFSEVCQPRNQPGELDPECPDSPDAPISDSSLVISFKGCCRTDVGKCGYMLDKLFQTIDIGLGCVDSEPFLDGGTAPACGSGAGGSGGAPPSATGGQGGA